MDPDDDPPRADWVHTHPTTCGLTYFHPDWNGDIYDTLYEKFMEEARDQIIEEEKEAIKESTLQNLVESTGLPEEVIRNNMDDEG